MRKSLLNNFIFNLIKTLCGVLFPVITFTYSARILGADGVGRVNFANSIVAYFSMLAVLGMNYYGTREAAKIRDNPEKLNQFVREALIINAVTTLCAYILFLIIIFTVPRLRDYRELLLIFSGAIFLQSMGMEWLYQALEEYRYIAVRSVLFQIIALFAMFLFVRKRDDLAAYAWIYMLATSGSYIFNFFHARKYIRLRIYPRRGLYGLGRHVRPLLWLFAMMVSIELYTVLDTTMVGFISGDAAVGRYTAAVKVNKVVIRIITSLGVVLIPRLSYYIGRQEKNRLEELVRRSYNYVFLLSFPCAVGLFCFNHEIIRLFCGEGFSSAAFTMRIMTPIVILIPFSVATNQQLFVPMGEEKRIMVSTCAGAGVNFICNSLLIPRYAENGAAVGTIMAETAVALVCFYNAGKFYHMREIFRYIWQYILAASPIPGVVWLARHYLPGAFWPCAAAIPVSGVVYALVLLKLSNPYAQEILRVYFSKFYAAR